MSFGGVLSTAFNHAAKGIEVFKNGVAAATGPVGLLKAAISGLWTVISAHPLVAIAGAIAGLVVLFTKSESAAEKASKKMDESFSAYESAKQKVADVNTELDQTKQSIDELEAKDGLTFVEQAELDKLREANELLKVQKDIAEREELEAKKTLAQDTVNAFNENFSIPINEERTQEKYNDRKGSSDPGVLMNNASDISSMIAGIKLMSELRDQMAQESKDWQTFSDAIDSATNIVMVDQMKTLTTYKENLESLPYNELTQEQQDALNEINGIIEYIYTELDSATWKQMQFDKIFDDRALADAKQKLVDFAKETNTAIKKEDIPSELKKAVESADFTVDDLVANINAEAEIINIDEVAKKLKSDFKENLEERINNNIDVETGIPIDPELDIDNTKKDELVSEFGSWFDSLSDEDKLIVWDAKCELDITDWDLDDFKSYLESKQQEVVESIEPPSFSSILESAFDPDAEDSSTVNEAVDDFQKNISTIQEALDSLEANEKVNLTDLTQEFPELANQTDNLAQALSQLKADQLVEFAKQWKQATSELSGVDAEQAQSFLKNLIADMDWSDVDIGFLRKNVYAMISDEVNKQYGQGLTGSERMNSSFISDMTSQYQQEFESFISEATALPSLSSIIQDENFDSTLSDYQSKMENLIAVRKKLNKTKGKLDDSDLQEILGLCPELIEHLDDIDGGIDELSNAANNDFLDYFANQIDHLREAGRDAEADALQEYADALVKNANTIEQTIIRLGKLEVPAPDVENWKESLETENPGDLYDDMVSGLKDAKEAFDKGLIGTDDFKSFAALISPTGSDDPANFLENYAKAERYLTEDSSGLQNFLTDMQELGYATQDIDGTWSWDLGNGIEGIQEAADKAGISVSFLMAMFSKAEDYGAYNDFFSTEEEGAERLDELYGDLAAEKRRLAEIKANPNTENYDTAVAESEAKIAEYEERIKALNEELDNFTAYTPEQVAERAAEAIEIAQSLQNDINNSTDEREKDYLQSELDDLMSERHLVVDVDGNFTSLEEAASNLDLDIDLDASVDNIDDEITKVSDHITQMNNEGISIDSTEMQSALDVLSYLIQRKQELEAPAVMSISTEQLANVDEDISNATTAVMNLQTAYNELEAAQKKDKDLGITANTEKAQENLEAAKKAFDEIDDSVKKELNIDVSMDADDQTILDQIKNMDLSAFDETPKLSYKFEITNETEYRDVMDKLEALSNSEEPANITVTADLSGVDQDQLKNIQTALDNYKKTNPSTTVKLEGLPNVKKDTQTAANLVNALDNVTGTPTISVHDQASEVIDTITRELNALALRKPINLQVNLTRTTTNKTVTESRTGGVSGINNSPPATTHKSSGVAKARGDARFLRKTTKKNETLVGELGRKYFAAAYSDVRRKYYLIAENS